MLELPKIPSYLRNPLEDVVDLGLDPVPFLLIKPMSVAHHPFVHQRLLEEGFSIADEFTISNYEKLACYVYNINRARKYRYQWLMLARAVVPESYDEAYVFLLNPIDDYTRLIDFKHDVREEIGLTPYEYMFYDAPYRTKDNHIHVANLGDLHREFNLLVQLCLSG